MISFPAPRLCQLEDEDLLVVLGEKAFPHSLHRLPGENGVRIWVEWETPTAEAQGAARSRFRVLLGALRSWRLGAGKLEVERLDGFGPGPRRDAAGNQFITVGPAVTYDLTGNPHITFSQNLASAIAKSDHLHDALWLNGRADRNAADFYMIHEYAAREFGGPAGITESLAVSRRRQNQMRKSANNLSPLDGGRHANQTRDAPLALEQQERYTADLLQRWIYKLTHLDSPGEMPYCRRKSGPT